MLTETEGRLFSAHDNCCVCSVLTLLTHFKTFKQEKCWYFTNLSTLYKQIWLFLVMARTSSDYIPIILITTQGQDQPFSTFIWQVNHTLGNQCG